MHYKQKVAIAQLTITIIALLGSSFSKDHSSASKLYCSSNTYRNDYACESRNLLEVWKTSLPIVPMKIMMSNFEMKNQSWVWLETNQKNTMHSLSFHPKSNYLYLQFLWFQIDVEFTFFFFRSHIDNLCFCLIRIKTKTWQCGSETIFIRENKLLCWALIFWNGLVIRKNLRKSRLL